MSTKSAIKFLFIPAVLAIGFLAIFPPQRQSAVWREPMDGDAANVNLARRFDRIEFGYLPSFRWIGHIGTTHHFVDERRSLVVDGVELYYDTYRWDVEWRSLAALGTIAIFMTAGVSRIRPRVKRHSEIP